MYPSCLHNLVALRLVLLAVQQDKLRNSVIVQLSLCLNTNLLGLIMSREVIKLLTEEQLDRYEAFRRSKLSKPNMRKVQSGIPMTILIRTLSICALQVGAMTRMLEL